MDYDRMTKEQLLVELAERGIECFDEIDRKSTLIAALKDDDQYAIDFPTAYVTPSKKVWSNV